MRKKFWNTFIDKNWDRRPASLVLPESSRISPETAFAGFVEASSRSRLGEYIDFRMYVGNSLLVVDREALTPQESDRGLASYLTRVSSQLHGRSFCQILRNLYLYHPEIASSLGALFQPLFARIGVPEEMGASLITGHYRSTAFGVHIDPDHTFYLMLKGTKRFYIWPPEFPETAGAPWGKEGQLGSCALDQYRDAATVLEAKPGVLLYWPPGYWHIAEGEPADSCALSIGLPIPGRPFLLDVIDEFLQAEMPQWLLLRTHRPGRKLPVPLQKQISAWKKLGTSLQGRMEHAWLARLSAHGMKGVVPLRPERAIRPSDLIHSRRDAFLYCKWSDGAMQCFANGHSFQVPQDRRTISMLKLLREGGKWKAAALIGRFPARTTAKGYVVALLSRLHRIGAIDIKMRSRFHD